MSLNIGIVGLPNAGKSTLFNALTKGGALVANYPFATIEPNVGIVELPDERLDELAKIYNSKKVVHATVEFVDIAGIVKDASVGAGLGNQFLARIREVDAICLLTRVFGDDSDPKGDIEIVETELILSDLQTIEKALPRIQKEARGGTSPKSKESKAGQSLLQTVEKAKRILEEGKTLYSQNLQIKDLPLLTSKPFIYAFNMKESDLNNDALRKELLELTPTKKAIFLDAKLEAEIGELDAKDAESMLIDFGIMETGLKQLIKVGFDTLSLQTFLTAGEKETKAWTIHKGDTAPKAAGVIHTDFEKGFIKAEVISYEDLMNAGNMNMAKSLGKVRVEGREYVMQEGDVVLFRFNI
jgi:GTP-binding protein YchF